MAVTAVIVRETEQDDGTWRVWLLFADTVSLKAEHRGPYRWAIPLRTDRQAAADAIAADSSGALGPAELTHLLAWVRQGLDADAFDLVHNTRPDSRKFLARELLNLMRDPTPGDEIDPDRLKHIIAQSRLFDDFSNPHIANTLLDGAWTASEVGTARQKAIALRDAAAALDHGGPELMGASR